MPASRRNADSPAADAQQTDKTPTTPERSNETPGRRPEKRFQGNSRLADARAFSRVFKHSKRRRDQYFTVLCRRSDDREPRLGLAIAKKHCKLATGRNRIKRLVRESFRTHKTELDGLDIVVMNTRATHGADNRTLHESLRKHWRQCCREQRRGGQD